MKKVLILSILVTLFIVLNNTSAFAIYYEPGSKESIEFENNTKGAEVKITVVKEPHIEIIDPITSPTDTDDSTVSLPKPQENNKVTNPNKSVESNDITIMPVMEKGQDSTNNQDKSTIEKGIPTVKNTKQEQVEKINNIKPKEENKNIGNNYVLYTSITIVLVLIVFFTILKSTKKKN